MQTHAHILPAGTCLALPGPVLWEPLLGPDLLLFDLPKNTTAPPFITVQKICTKDCRSANITQAFGMIGKQRERENKARRAFLVTLGHFNWLSCPIHPKLGVCLLLHGHILQQYQMILLNKLVPFDIENEKWGQLKHRGRHWLLPCRQIPALSYCANEQRGGKWRINENDGAISDTLTLIKCFLRLWKVGLLWRGAAAVRLWSVCEHVRDRFPG